MASTLIDMSIVATDVNFGNRVLASLTIYCATTVQSEVTSASLTAEVHQARKNYAAAVLNNPTAFKPLFVNTVSSNQAVADAAVATAGSSLVGLTSTQVAAAITTATPTTTGVTDTLINNAVASEFSAFVSGI